MKKKLLTRLNVALGTAIVGLVGFYGCGCQRIKNVSDPEVEDKYGCPMPEEIRAMYGVPMPDPVDTVPENFQPEPVN
jgi:hypothetical protein